MDNKHLYNDVFFNDVRIPEYDRIGAENDGWNLTRATMNFERSGAGVFAAAKTTLQEIIDYVKTTKRDGKFLSENPIVRQKIAKLFIDTEVGQALAYRITWLQQQGGLIFAASAASESKVFGTELSQRMANYATEIMGLYGQLEESQWAPLEGTMATLYQFCTGMNIWAGSNEIQRNLIAWVGLNLPRFK
jgi:alkylation response protein AidB-like acyl-CoA dehydrogenase